MHLDGDNEKDEKNSCSGLQPPAFYVAGSQASGLCPANYGLYQTGYVTVTNARHLLNVI